jgi:Flp pilus assembly pilin Flp
VNLRNSAKEVAPRPLSVRINTDVLIDAAEGGGAHRVIVRGIAAERGQAVPEYALIIALVTTVLIASYQVLGSTALRLIEEVVAAF